ncbi:MAG TPA: Ig-like domain-containing protein [Methanospirillum sp.]|uniref:Ig-like domain-containing protein n=1 Tax=Methanospirillum sp. TaxID=45200 RepID=UPI002B79FC60|nr:Ig-like domain-containing protein [Methanospirillum sp.]HOJ95932.1 Ig-like domain-containing protein [Methanospirillum sp.]HOL41623.1 Ig-like domain-containing protein [Methanospirillum sp.]HPP77768.1 Ig-like domain-containing protein [Methanospirillum sp.]
MHIRSFLIILVWIGLFLIPHGYAYQDETRENTQPSDLIQLKELQDEVIIGDKITLTGQIDRSLFGTQPSDVIILIYAPTGSHADTFMLAKPAPNGSFRYNQIADVGGDWGFEALYTGIYSEKVSVLAVPGNEPKKTALTLSGWPTFPKIGDYVSFKGRLTDSEGKGIPQKEIIYRLASSPVGCLGGCAFGGITEWREAGSVSTDTNGEYSFSLPVVESGSVQIEAVFSGDDGYSAASSNTLKITVYE